jgi:hypothetical protein
VDDLPAGMYALVSRAGTEREGKVMASKRVVQSILVGAVGLLALVLSLAAGRQANAQPG